MKRLSLILAGLALGGLLPALAVGQEPGYRSVFSDYRPYRAAEPLDWRAANRAVAETAGPAGHHMEHGHAMHAGHGVDHGAMPGGHTGHARQADHDAHGSHAGQRGGR
ncbi:MAG: hypothetical protein AB1697_13135 [Pseudomonadota bacterium]